MKPYWSISEACAWIVTRDLDAVEHVSNSDPEAVHFLLGGDALPPYRFCEHVLEWPPSCGWHALTQIQQYCGDERITMSGVPEDGSARKSIPTIEWADLLISHSEALACWMAAAAPVGNPSTRWIRLRLLSADVQRLWPPIEATTKGPSIATAAKTSEQLSARSAGRKAIQRGQARDWIKAKHPEGIPDTLSNAALIAAMKVDKIFVSERTVIRARGGK